MINTIEFWADGINREVFHFWVKSTIEINEQEIGN